MKLLLLTLAVLLACLTAVPVRQEEVPKEEIRLERSAESSGGETARVEKRAAIDTGSDYPGFEGGKRRWYG
ncbi:hypothetical protein ACHWQZ_G015673 [Mnemiopsis leidyi]